MSTKKLENKERVNAWLPPSMIKNIETLCEPNNIKNKSEFIYHAVDFYIGYLASQDSTASADPFCHSFDLPFCSKIAG